MAQLELKVWAEPAYIWVYKYIPIVIEEKLQVYKCTPGVSNTSDTINTCLSMMPIEEPQKSRKGNTQTRSRERSLLSPSPCQNGNRMRRGAVGLPAMRTGTAAWFVPERAVRQAKIGRTKV
jgi:hypothetical protein